MEIVTQSNPTLAELRTLFSAAFMELAGQDDEKFSTDQGQSLDEWFSLNELPKYLQYGICIEAREDGKLVGAAIIAQQNPLTWPDGKKAELFIIAVLPAYRHQQIGKKLLMQAEFEAHKFGAHAIIVNTNSLMESTMNFYLKNGYEQIGELHGYYNNGAASFFLKRLPTDD